MFDFERANEGQREAISTTEGPVLIIAGPGTGKTYTLVKRAMYLIKEKKVEPENILIATFTEKAAKELMTRMTNELIKSDLDVNLNDMYVGTFHSICLRIIKENIEYTRIKKNYKTLDTFDQNYMVYQHFYRFKNIENIKDVLGNVGVWDKSQKLCAYFNTLAEETVDPDDLIKDDDLSVAAIGNAMKIYMEMLDDSNALDFSAIQTETYKLLLNQTKIREKLQEKLKYIMVDEYQDTNYIQEQLILLLGGKTNNICVVGDDDQGLYRFRGATIRNILEFPKRFGKRKCKMIYLSVNYRSNPQIIDFYNNWMETSSGSNFKFEWENFRFGKKITPGRKVKVKSSAVIKISAINDADEWNTKIYEFITRFKKSKNFTDLNQIAFLFKSVKHSSVTKLSSFLELKGINVYSPRSGMFFDREEIKVAIGIFIFLFRHYMRIMDDFDPNEEKYKRGPMDYYKECRTAACEILKSKKYKDLSTWVVEQGSVLDNMTKDNPESFADMFYHMLGFRPFSDWISEDMKSGVVDLRPARNLAIMSQTIDKFVYLHNIQTISAETVEKDIEKFFDKYIKFLKEGGISEYEDDSEYAPSGCVSFLTIHQSKGMEFPIVFVDSLYSFPRDKTDNLLVEIEKKYYKRRPFEPYKDIKFFDFWRLFYTAFSRAQDLLILTTNETNKAPSKYFKDAYSAITDYNSDDFDLSVFKFSEVKDVNIKHSFSFTANITVYENCAVQYKFLKELEFAQTRMGAFIFGQLVHQTIEDIHRSALRDEESKITPSNIERWLTLNYESISKSEHAYLAQNQIKAALNQVMKYYDRQKDDWSVIKDAEVEITLTKPDYIIDGKIDLIKGDGNTVDIIDFKAEKKPDIERDKDKLSRYKKQLEIYAHLVEKKTGQTINKMRIYYTGEEDGRPTITFDRDEKNINKTIQEFDDVVHQIIKKNFVKKSDSQRQCENCDFRYYCSNRI